MAQEQCHIPILQSIRKNVWEGAAHSKASVGHTDCHATRRCPGMSKMLLEGSLHSPSLPAGPVSIPALLAAVSILFLVTEYVASLQTVQNP